MLEFYPTIYYTYFYLLHHAAVQIYMGHHVGGLALIYISLLEITVNTQGNLFSRKPPSWLLKANC